MPGLWYVYILEEGLKAGVMLTMWRGRRWAQIKLIEPQVRRRSMPGAREGSKRHTPIMLHYQPSREAGGWSYGATICIWVRDIGFVGTLD
ncbi:MAG: hypothetical protein AAGA97_09505 [Pseudomonadota bacterium]